MTFLFTDIEGSTRRWESDADAMRVALACHDKVLRSAIEANDGFVFSHSGDGLAAAFASPSAAVAAAVDAQRELNLSVRMGVATGEAELRDGDYFGTVLNRAARVMAAGHGGQILVAESTAVLLAGVELVDLGPRRLRDVSVPVTLFQLHAPGLRTYFPPLRTLDPGSGNLRRVPAPLVGREAELAELASAVRTRRLVTLTGVGGVGKTRLALEVAQQLSSEFPDGVWLFELSAVNDEAAVPDAVAAVLGVTQQPGKTMAESVASTLEDRLRLLVFDNCEHVLDATADLIEAILGASTTVRVLATSREGLALSDEQTWPVRSLELAAAVDLFIQRAHNVAPGMMLDDEPVIREVCRRLDSLPLAIELAASRTSSMGVEEIRDRLDHRFALLVGSRRRMDRHQNLRNAVAWSYDLLEDSERRLLERCSVFAGGFDLKSVCAVGECDGADEYTILDVLDSLVRKSLLTADRAVVPTRFSMLETIREFAEEQLVSTGHAEEARNAHPRHFARRSASVLDLWDSPRQGEAYRWFMTELPDLRIAFRWAADHADIQTAAALTTFAGFLGMCVENYEPTSWAEEILESARAARSQYLGYLYVIASLCYFAGRIDDGVRYGEAGHAALRDHIGWDAPFTSIQCNLGGAYLSIGRPDLWVDVCCAELDSGRDRRSFVSSSLAMALALANRSTEAMAVTADLLDNPDTERNPYAFSYALLAYGYVWRDTDPAAALRALRRGLKIAQENGVRANESILAMTLGRVEAEHGDPQAALDCIALAIRNYRDSGNIAVIGVPLANLAVLLDRRGRYEESATLLGFAHGPMTAVTIPEVEATVAHLREVLGDGRYETLIQRGETMTTSAVANYAYEQIDQACAQLQELR
ncbi:cyclase [Mycobacterium sp. IS-1590]|uniref:adenylate/guanylate cyclase domain-containing protein n=1 Tax=Mycobacterium sp. IS-1590 TaxID=1772286 RepID=UPI00074629F3|nr:adenylate/guanylate cyclase domain-containing protein [Mycobacterium sp. IS-1590]KUI34157.1 cyclase [Mycobacterium sp. IS-1590]